MKSKVLVLVLISAFVDVSAAKKLGYISFAVNNYVTAKPISGFPKLFYSQFHPGITVSTGFNWKVKDKHNWSQSFKFSCFNHRYVQTSILLYTEFGYRYKWKNWGFTAALGGGYLHMIPGEEQFKQDGNGNWESVKLRSRPQGMLSLSLGIDKSIGDKGHKIFVRYQNVLQTPFITGYVPILPYNVLHVGYSIPLKNKKGGSDAKK
jgi:hypothetical protein